jgi:hypothetical protein
MPKQGRDIDVLFTFYVKNADGTQGDPLYLTTNGESGGTAIDCAAWLKRYAEDADAVLELATGGGGLTVQAAPGDNQLLWHSDFTDVDMQPGCYVMDIVGLLSDTSRIDLGTFEVTIRSQVTEVPVP